VANTWSMKAKGIILVITRDVCSWGPDAVSFVVALAFMEVETADTPARNRKHQTHSQHSARLMMTCLRRASPLPTSASFRKQRRHLRLRRQQPSTLLSYLSRYRHIHSTWLPLRLPARRPKRLARSLVGSKIAIRQFTAREPSLAVALRAVAQPYSLTHQRRDVVE
jgi:hypothetical protein